MLVSQTWTPAGRGASLGARPQATGQIKVAYMGAFLLLFSLSPFHHVRAFSLLFFYSHAGLFSMWGAILSLCKFMGGLFWACPTPTKISAASMGPDSTTPSLVLLCGVWQFVIGKSVQFLDCSSMTWETC